MPNYSPRRDFIGVVLACLGMVTIAIIGASFAQSIMEGLSA